LKEEKKSDDGVTEWLLKKLKTQQPNQKDDWKAIIGGSWEKIWKTDNESWLLKPNSCQAPVKMVNNLLLIVSP
jgi:hypothetical protein